ncbi:MAG TPA: histidine kinase [Clostridiales bacterium]|nr:histidine kinase [Clostridiales bacterium]
MRFDTKHIANAFAFRNYSIKKKMIIALILCVLLPFFVITFIMSNILTAIEMKENRKEETYIIEDISMELENIAKRADEFAESNLGSGAVKDILRDRGSMNDYLILYDNFKNFVAHEDIKETIYLVKNGTIVFQIGDYYLYPDVNLSVENTYPGKGSWSGVDKIKVFGKGFSKSLEFLSRSYPVYDYSNNSYIGQIVVSYSMEEICSRSIDKFASEDRVNVLYHPSGRVLAYSNRNGMEEESDLLDKIPPSQSLGYVNIQSDKQKGTLYYSRLNSGFTIVRMIKRQWQPEILINLVLTVFVCVLFGFACIFILNKYIIEPLNALSDKMKHVKLGESKEIKIRVNQDEIGSIVSEYDKMMKTINSLIEQVYIEKINKQEAEKNALISQLKPHFLYNTLDSIKWLAIKIKAHEVAAQLEALSEIYRNVLNFGREMIAVEEEKKFLENYFYLMKERASVPMELIIDIDKELKFAYLPKLIIQPLVENSINHGLINQDNGGTIYVGIRKKVINFEELIEIRVFDNGVGTNAYELMKTIKDENPKSAFALRNIDRRIRLKYGEKSKLLIFSKKSRGTLVLVRLKYTG